MVSNWVMNKLVEQRSSIRGKHLLRILNESQEILRQFDAITLKRLTATTVQELKALEEEIKEAQQKAQHRREQKERKKERIPEAENKETAETKTEERRIEKRKSYHSEVSDGEEQFYQSLYEQHQRNHRLILQRYLTEEAIKSRNAPYEFFYNPEKEALHTTKVEIMKYEEVEDFQRRAKYGISFDASKTGAEKLQYYYWSISAHNQVLEYVLYAKA